MVTSLRDGDPEEKWMVFRVRVARALSEPSMGQEVLVSTQVTGTIHSRACPRDEEGVLATVFSHIANSCGASGNTDKAMWGPSSSTKGQRKPIVIPILPGPPMNTGRGCLGTADTSVGTREAPSLR